MFLSSLTRWRKRGAGGHFSWSGAVKQEDLPLLLELLPDACELKFAHLKFHAFGLYKPGREVHLLSACGLDLSPPLKEWLLEGEGPKRLQLPGFKLEQALDLPLDVLELDGFCTPHLASALSTGRLQARKLLLGWNDEDEETPLIELLGHLQSHACRVLQLPCGMYTPVAARLIEVREFQRGVVHFLAGDNLLSRRDGDRACLHRALTYLTG